MRWNEFNSKTKTIMTLMLVAAAMPIGTLVIFLLMFDQGIPWFVYILSLGWIIFFLFCFKNLKHGIIGGIIWAILSALAPIGPILAGVPNPLSEALDVPICPFAATQIVISLVIIYLGYSEYRELKR